MIMLTALAVVSLLMTPIMLLPVILALILSLIILKNLVKGNIELDFLIWFFLYIEKDITFLKLKAIFKGNQLYLENLSQIL